MDDLLYNNHSPEQIPSPALSPRDPGFGFTEHSQDNSVDFKRCIQSILDHQSNTTIPILLGRNVGGFAETADLKILRHMLIVGMSERTIDDFMTTILCTLLLTNDPVELRLLLVDTPTNRFAMYKHIPHLITPVETSSENVLAPLKWANAEIGRRFKLLERYHTKTIGDYHTHRFCKAIAPEAPDLPFVVMVVDELADLSGEIGNRATELIIESAHLGPAVGFHLICATRYPDRVQRLASLKASLLSRVVFKTSSLETSKKLIGYPSAESFLGDRDFLVYRSNRCEIEWFQAAMVPIEDVETILGNAASVPRPSYTDLQPWVVP
jgi:S-DNA-T family DNA segregation ATPase FtsK/SpoIIIE